MNNTDSLLLAYRIWERGGSLTGESIRYSLTPPPDRDSHRVERVELVHVRLEPGVRVATSAAGERLLYRPPHVYGKRLSEGFILGWCELEEPETG
ncbi:MAG: hypothetical protein ACK47B_06275 [Armatimonadota bacterium]